jgi:autotransporter-associated beta strand protein
VLLPNKGTHRRPVQRGTGLPRHAAALLAFSVLLLAALPAAAQNATWNFNPGSGDFNTAANWNPATVPTGTAFFGTSNTAALSFSANTTIGGWTFNAGASNYTFTNNGQTINFTDAGIVVSGGSATVTNNGFLQFFDTSTAGRASITNTNVGTLTFNNASTAGSATITNNVNGFLQFFNTSTGGSASITNNGFLQFFDTSTAGSATIINNNGLQFSNTSTAGSATITNSGGAITFSNTSTAGSATITNNQLLQFLNTSTAGNATIINDLTLRFFATSTAGTARLINGAGGTIDISLLSNAGMTAGSIEGAGTISLGSRNLAVGGNNLSTTFSGVLADGGGGGGGGGSLTKTGTGTLTLSGTSTYTGATTVNAGTLEVDGSIASSSAVFVNSGGTLSGTGIVDPVSTQIASGGTLAPGNATNPTGVLTVTGGLSFVSGAIYLVQVSGANAGRTNVAGSGSLAGTVEMGVIGSAQGNHNYDILHAAGGLNGTTFSGAQSLAPGFTPSLSYSATDVFLSLTANLGSGGGLGGNQQNVATAINNVFNSGGTLPPGFINLFNLSGAPLSNALTQVSGETATGSQQTTFDAMGMFMGLLTDPFMQRNGSPGSTPGASGYADEASAYAAKRTASERDAYAMFTKAPLASSYDPRWSVWAAGFGGSQNTDGNTAAGTNNTTSSIAGTAVGADYLFSPNTIAGFALAGGGTSFSVANGGTGHSDLFQVGAYVRHTNGPAYISAAVAYGWQDITTNRTVTVAGFDQLRAQFNANAWSGRLEGGYRFVAPWTGGVGITPYAAAQFVTFDLPAYAEQAIVGTNNFALAYGARDATDVRTELGIRTDKSWLVTDGVLTLRGRLAWAHDYDPDRSIGATFQSLPGASFVVNGAPQAADSALTTASIEMKWRNNWSVAATFEGEFSNVTSSYAGKGVVRYVW